MTPDHASRSTFVRAATTGLSADASRADEGLASVMPAGGATAACDGTLLRAASSVADSIRHATGSDSNEPKWLGLELRRNRWLFPMAGMLTTALWGAVAYAFSIFIPPLEQEFGWARPSIVLAFSFCTLFYAIFMFLGGIAVDRFGPRRPFVVGAVLIVFSQLLASTISSTLGLILTYGVLLGCGVGLTYSSATVALAARWYPELRERGIAIGFSVMGFGFGGLIAAPLWRYGIEGIGWRSTFVATAFVYAIVLSVIASLVRFPQATEETKEDVRRSSEEGDLTLQDAMLTREFWTIALLFFLAIFGGVMVVSQLFPFMTEAGSLAAALQGTDTSVSVVTGGTVLATTGIAAQALANSLGRPAWGWLSGVLGLRISMFLCSTTMLIGLLLLASLSESAFLGERAVASALPIFSIALIGVAYGGVISLCAVASAAIFGSMYLARIFGLIFCMGFGLAGLLGPWAGAALRQSSGDYDLAFYVGASLAGLSAILAVLMLPRRGRERRHSDW